MAIIRWLVAALISSVGVVFLLLAAYVGLIPSSAQFHKLSSTETALIGPATEFMREFNAKNSRNPTSAEFDTWKEAHSAEFPGFDGCGYTLLDPPFPSELQSRLGQPPHDAFVLNYLDHGAWIDYASWFDEGKLAYVPDSEYFSPFFGKYSAVAVLSAISIALFAIAAMVAPCKHFRIWKAARRHA